MAKTQTNVGMVQLLEFKVAFPGDKPLSVEEYLKGGSKAMILKVAAFLLGSKSQDSKYHDNREFLGAIFGPENNALANSVNDKITEIERKGTRVRIINTYASLKLFESFFTKEEEPETQTHDEFETNIFKAYLTLNSEFTKNQDAAISSTEELEDELKIAMMMFCSDYPISDKENYDIKQVWGSQMIKTIYLFQYLERNVATRPLLSAFLAYFNKATWQDYLKSFVSLTIPSIKDEKEGHTDIRVTNDDDFEQNCSFIEKLMVNEYDELDANDFLTLRAKPLYKIENGVYRIIFDLFLVEKIFKGVYFSLRDTNEKLPVGQKITGWKGIYCYEFSEKTLAYKVIESIFPDKSIKFTGQQLTDMKVIGAPDYYVRKGNNIFVFESKDFLIRADKKVSFDYSIYEEEFSKTLYYEMLPNGKEKAGAVIQLINTIRKLLKSELKVDTDYKYKDVFIYPILLTHDRQYDVFGLNTLVNYWFQYELQGLKEEGLFTHKVKPLTVVNIDSLIYHQGGLKENITLNKVIDNYYEEIKLDTKLRFKTETETKSYLMSKQIPFSFFIDNYFSEKGIRKLPILLNIVAPALFEEEQLEKETNI